MQNTEQYILSQQERYQTTLFEFLRIPSVSADPKYRPDVTDAAVWLEKLLSYLGFQAETIATKGNPLVYAETPPVPDGKTILVYGHYDVQPPEPLDLWETPPFEPTVREGNVYARGATDDKGQFLTHLFAAEAYLKKTKSPKIQIKFLFEGEEESSGSVSLYEFLKNETNRKKLACDYVIVSDSSMFGENQPAITYGLRGILSFELFIIGPNRDLHSGDFGGTVLNPGIALTKMLAGLVDGNGKILVPHIYEDVCEITSLEKEELQKLPFNEQDFFKKIGLNEGFGERGFTTLERRWCRPTFDINGITCGYQGEGSKTIIPSQASAKFTLRLVPNQKPEKVAENVKRRLMTLLPPGVQMRLKYEHGAPGMLSPLESPYIQKAATALHNVFGSPPVFTRQGGSIPIVAELRDRLGAEVLLLGWGQDDDNPHAPNEKFSLRNFQRGTLVSAQLMHLLGE
ncbi:MAG: dipeptidase [Planctomycetaceae bacterium]|nr:dipeptidase [Planctomycetaceae bacterium]